MYRDVEPITDAPPDSQLPPEARQMVAGLYQAHALGLVKLAKIMPGGQSLAEDIVQDAFLGLYRRWPYLDLPELEAAETMNVSLGVIDTQAGQRLAQVEHPRGISLDGVTGAADDRTFLVSALSTTFRPVPGTTQRQEVFSWYLRRLTPGRSQPDPVPD